MDVTFFEEARNQDLKFAVIAARYDGKWLLCRQRGKTTWEFPGGHREEGENIYYAAKRELWEETGATGYQLESVAAYSFTYQGETGMGALYYADIWELGPLPEAFEIEEVRLFEVLPPEMSYPTLQPALLGRVEQWLAEGGYRSQMEDMFEMLI